MGYGKAQRSGAYRVQYGDLFTYVSATINEWQNAPIVCSAELARSWFPRKRSVAKDDLCIYKYMVRNRQLRFYTYSQGIVSRSCIFWRLEYIFIVVCKLLIFFVIFFLLSVLWNTQVSTDTSRAVFIRRMRICTADGMRAEWPDLGRRVVFRVDSHRAALAVAWFRIRSPIIQALVQW